jgi:hypothetical protein
MTTREPAVCDAALGPGGTVFVPPGLSAALIQDLVSSVPPVRPCCSATMYDRNYYFGVLVVLVIILLALLFSPKTRWWACGALAGIAVGTALGWWMAKAPPGTAMQGMWGSIDSR